MDKEGPDQSALMCRLIQACIVHKWHEGSFRAFPSYVVDKHKKCFTEVILMSSQNVYYGAKHYKESP